jgi:hypothetical protein
MKSFNEWLNLRENINPKMLQSYFKDLMTLAPTSPHGHVIDKVKADFISGNLSPEIQQAIVAAGDAGDLKILADAYAKSRNPAAAQGAENNMRKTRNLKQSFEEMQFANQNNPVLAGLLNKVAPLVANNQVPPIIAQAIMSGDANKLHQAYIQYRKNPMG